MFPVAREKLNNFILVLKETFNSFQKNTNFEMAATLSFYSFFALIPLLLLAIYPLGSYLISSQSALEEIERLFPKQFPEINKVIIKEVATITRPSALWEAFTLLTVSLWSLIRPAFALVLQVKPNYGFTFGSLKAIFLLVIRVYYSFAAILAGAEIMANMKRKEALLLRGLFFNHKTGRKIPNKFIKVFGIGEKEMSARLKESGAETCQGVL